MQVIFLDLVLLAPIRRCRRVARTRKQSQGIARNGSIEANSARIYYFEKASFGSAQTNLCHPFEIAFPPNGVHIGIRSFGMAFLLEWLSIRSDLLSPLLLAPPPPIDPPVLGLVF
jgi:hypothetical protein